LLDLDSIRNKAAALLPEMVAVRRDLHMYPELGFQERRTAAVIAAKLLALGLEVETGVAGTGVIGRLSGRRPGRTVALRADMDALPLAEANELTYASRRPGVMHACGHDGHVAMLLGAAALLAEEREELDGNVAFIFQPAEEGTDGGGARRLVALGVLAHPPADAVIGLHLWTGLPVGTLAVRSGPCMAASDSFTLVIRGVGGHGAAPQGAIDPIVAGAHVVTALQTIVSREINPAAAAVITVGTFHAGTANNIIAPTAELRGTVRSLDAQLRQLLPERIEGIVRGITQALRAEYEFDYTYGYPVLNNDLDLTACLTGIAASLLGPEQIITLPQPVLGSEDFAYYLEKVPGVFAFLGAGNPAKATGLPHQPRYNFDEDALPLGAAILAGTACAVLAGAVWELMPAPGRQELVVPFPNLKPYAPV